MTDKEMVEDYLKDESRYLIEDREGNLINITKKVEQAFLAGLKASKEQFEKDCEEIRRKYESIDYKS